MNSKKINIINRSPPTAHNVVVLITLWVESYANNSSVTLPGTCDPTCVVKGADGQRCRRLAVDVNS